MRHQGQRYSTYTRLSGDTSRNYDNFDTGEGFCETIIIREETLDLGGGCDVREIRSDTGGSNDIVEAQLERL